MANVYKVTARLPATVELSRRTTKDTLTLVIKGGEKPGKLVISQGTIEWWPEHKSANVHRADWDAFAVKCEELPKRRSVRKSKRPKK